MHMPVAEIEFDTKTAQGKAILEKLNPQRRRAGREPTPARCDRASASRRRPAASWPACLLVTCVARRDAGWHAPIELPLLAIAMAMRREAISTFGGVWVQTIVVTNNMVKFTDAVVGRYLSPRSAETARPGLDEVLLPGLAWLGCSIAGGAAALLEALFACPLLIPAVLLTLAAFDLLRTGAPPRAAMA